jgi:ornithine carbamoyltransferase
MLGIQLAADFAEQVADCPPAKAPCLYMVEQLHEAGLLSIPSGTHAIRWLPSLNVSAPRSTRRSAFLPVCCAPWQTRRASNSHNQQPRPMKHLLSIQALSAEEIHRILDLAIEMKTTRGKHTSRPLEGQCWAMMFSKSSTRTRVSFEVGVRELGGNVIFLAADDIQLGRGEPIKDTARVLGRMCHGAIIRTFAQKDVEDFAQFSGIPTINALTDEEHPCQILADLQTIREKLGSIEGKTVTFVGDGACNVPVSWLWAATKLKFKLRIAAPKKYQPDAALVKRAGDMVSVTDDVAAAARDADILYTDVWVSMGREDESEYRIAQLGGYHLTQEIVAHAKPKALVMHCLPAYRGKEISDETFEANAQTIFDQAENRLHAQKAILSLVVEGWR